MRPLTPLLVVALALGLVCEGSAQDTPADNRYRTGDTSLQVETVQTDLDARTADRVSGLLRGGTCRSPAAGFRAVRTAE